jgi:hypothetical protein
MIEALKGALLALPELVKGIREIASAITRARDAAADRELQEIKDELNEQIKRLPNASDRDSLYLSVRRLNRMP